MVCETEDFSEGGLALNLPTALVLEKSAPVSVSIFRGEREYSFPAVVAFSQGSVLRVRFDQMGLQDYQALVAATFSRGDAWQEWLPDRDTDHPLRGFKEVFIISRQGLSRFLLSLAGAINWKRWNIGNGAWSWKSLRIARWKKQ
jgi:cellulose synthase (UDP-forming)